MENEIKYIMKRDPKLLWVAKNICGPSVVNAWVATMHFDSDSVLDTNDELNTISGRLAITPADTDVSFDSETIVLEFTGGSRVYFSNSEWASFGIAENYKEIQ